MTFDPNAPEADPGHRWSSYSDTRNRDHGFKTHSKFQMMRSAIDNCRAITCYERVDGKWVTIYEHTAWNRGGVNLEGDGEHCHFCNEDFRTYGFGWWYWSGDTPFSKRKLCSRSPCKRKNGVYKPPDEPLDPSLYCIIPHI
jgi:hypothetical protein